MNINTRSAKLEFDGEHEVAGSKRRVVKSPYFKRVPQDDSYDEMDSIESRLEGSTRQRLDYRSSSRGSSRRQQSQLRDNNSTKMSDRNQDSKKRITVQSKLSRGSAGVLRNMLDRQNLDDAMKA